MIVVKNGGCNTSHSERVEQHEHAHVIVVKNGGCNTSHSERVEQAFYTKYTGK